MSIGALIGYGRTSSTDQKAGLEDQIAMLERAGCQKVYSEHLSGIDAARPELAKALDFLRVGDVFVVCKPDRLARSTMDLLKIADDLTARGVGLRILSMDIDTSTPTGRLMLTLLAGIAQFERELMLERQRAGVQRAKAEGKYKGRPPKVSLRSAEVLALKAEGVRPSEIIRRTGISKASVYRMLEAA